MSNLDRLSQVDLNLLYTFRTFVQAGSLREAARRLGRAEPSVSARLHRLESDLGLKLFERIGRRLQLTAVGNTFFEDALAIIGSAQDLADKAAALSQTPKGTYRIGSLSAVAAYLLAKPVAQFSAGNPGALVQVISGLAPELVAALRDGGLDAIVSIGSRPPKGFDVTTLGVIRPVLAIQKSDRLGLRGGVTASDLQHLDYIAYGKVTGDFFEDVDRFIRKYNVDQRIRLQVTLIQAAKALVAAGAGVSILPDYTIVEPQLAALPIKELQTSHSVWLATRKNAVDIPGVAELRQEIADSLAPNLRLKPRTQLVKKPVHRVGNR